METITAIIVDDEKPARNTLLSFLDTFCQGVHVVAECNNVPDAVLAINKLNPDVIFLDVEMPDYDGFELLNFFKRVEFEIIFVTAYSDFAVRAFEVSAIDYLLKPIQIEALRVAVEKVKNKRRAIASEQRLELLKASLNNEEIRKIALPMNDGLLFTDIDEIVMIEADGAYSNIYLKNGSKILISKKLKFFEDLLSSRSSFFRPHRSFLINLSFLRKYTRGQNHIELENAHSVVIARDRKVEFEALLKKLRLAG